MIGADEAQEREVDKIDRVAANNAENGGTHIQHFTEAVTATAEDRNVHVASRSPPRDLGTEAVCGNNIAAFLQLYRDF